MISRIPRTMSTSSRPSLRMSTSRSSSEVRHLALDCMSLVDGCGILVGGNDLNHDLVLLCLSKCFYLYTDNNAHVVLCTKLIDVLAINRIDMMQCQVEVQVFIYV